MDQVLTNVFIRVVTQKVEDCTHPIQLRGYLNKYRSYVFSPSIVEIFNSRISFFRDEFVGDSLALETCDDLEEILDSEIKISKVINNVDMDSNHPKLERALIADDELGVVESYPLPINELKSLIMEFEGDLLEISDMKKMPVDVVYGKIKLYNLYAFLRKYSK